MENENKKFGIFGEDIAVRYLDINKYKIISRNFHCQYGEIDIIGIKNNLLVFIEVKSRKINNKNSALNSVSISKRIKISRTASIFLSKNPEFEDHLTRFDVITIIYDRASKNYKIDHLKDAFSPILP